MIKSLPIKGSSNWINIVEIIDTNLAELSRIKTLKQKYTIMAMTQKCFTHL